jgi:transcriptional regulator with XRE-family HTH domain
MMPRRHKFDKRKILELREQGYTYQEIGEELGCTKQYIGQICGKYNPNRFQFITESGCVYPNLRKWMNENKISRKELIRRSGIYETANSSYHLTGILEGKSQPPKPTIDKLIAATGMPYEVLFSQVEYKEVKAVSATQFNELLCKYNELLDAADDFCDVYLRHRREYSYEMEDE